MTNRQVIAGMTMFERQQVLDTNTDKSRFAKEQASKLVGAGAVYPPAGTPWSPNSPQPGDEPPIDCRDPSPVVGEPHEVAKADRLSALRRERNRCVLEQKLIDPADPRVEEWQVKRDRLEVEIMELENG